MSTVRHFSKCGTCGTPGHNDSRCPVRDYNRELESRGNITAKMLFPGRPDLVRLLEEVQSNWIQSRQPL